MTSLNLLCVLISELRTPIASRAQYDHSLLLSGAGSSYMSSPSYESHFSPQISDILASLGFTEEDLILMSTRDLNKNLKVDLKMTFIPSREEIAGLMQWQCPIYSFYVISSLNAISKLLWSSSLNGCSLDAACLPRGIILGVFSVERSES